MTLFGANGYAFAKAYEKTLSAKGGSLRFLLTGSICDDAIVRGCAKEKGFSLGLGESMSSLY